MKNFINWMCLFAVMGLVFQVMVYINADVINQFKKNKSNKNKKAYMRRTVENTKLQQTVSYYSEKIAK